MYNVLYFSADFVSFSSGVKYFFLEDHKKFLFQFIGMEDSETSQSR